MAVIAVGQVVGLEGGRPQPLHGITAFRNRRSRLIECALQSLPGFLWAFGEYLQDRLEPEQKSLKTLQQRVVQFARNACALTHPRFQGHVELVRELPDTEPVGGEEQGQEGDDAQHSEPVCLVPHRRNHEIQRRAFLVPHPAVVGGHHAKPVRPGPQVRVVHMARVDRHSASRCPGPPA